MEEILAVVIVLEALGIVRLHGKGLVRAAARLYVGVSQKSAEAIDPIKRTWQDAVAEARSQQARQVARAEGRTRQGVKAQEKRGERNVKLGAKGTAEAAGVAGQAAVSA